MKYLIFTLLLFCLQPFFYAQSLSVHESGRYLTHSDGTAFLWLGDTAWELFHRLNREEATRYLENRAKKGFTVIQAVVLAENDGLRVPNAYGDLPLKDLDPTQPNEAYFEHVDFIVDKAAELGLYIAMLPTWGDKIYSNNPGAGPIVFDSENAAVFGEFLGKRYRDKPIVWVLGGDRNIANAEVLAIWRAMAHGLAEGDQGNHLISYHPRGASSSSYWLHNEPWLDFNMYQSGHEGHFNRVYEYAENEALLPPRKPFIDAEPAYEDIAIRFWEYMDFSQHSAERVPAGVLDDEGLIADTAHFAQGFITDYDVRIHAYWNFLAGACGYTYGNNAIWQMYKKGGYVAIPALYDWETSMDRPGAQDILHIHDIFQLRPFEKLIPDQSIIYGPNPQNEMHIRAAGAVDQSFMMVYLAIGQPVELNLTKLNHQANAWWYNPRDGGISPIGTFDNTVIQTFTPPTAGKGNDWLLVLDDITQYPEMPEKQ